MEQKKQVKFPVYYKGLILMFFILIENVLPTIFLSLLPKSNIPNLDITYLVLVLVVACAVGSLFTQFLLKINAKKLLLSTAILSGLTSVILSIDHRCLRNLFFFFLLKGFILGFVLAYATAWLDIFINPDKKTIFFDLVIFGRIFADFIARIHIKFLHNNEFNFKFHSFLMDTVLHVVIAVLLNLMENKDFEISRENKNFGTKTKNTFIIGHNYLVIILFTSMELCKAMFFSYLGKKQYDKMTAELISIILAIILQKTLFKNYKSNKNLLNMILCCFLLIILFFILGYNFDVLKNSCCINLLLIVGILTCIYSAFPTVMGQCFVDESSKDVNISWTYFFGTIIGGFLSIYDYMKGGKYISEKCCSFTVCFGVIDLILAVVVYFVRKEKEKSEEKQEEWKEKEKSKEQQEELMEGA